MNKTGMAVASIIAVLLVVLLIIALVVHFAGRECSNNTDCDMGSYCGSDFSCHKYPDEILVKDYSFFWAALVLAIGLIIAAYIRRGGKLPHIFKRS